MGTRTILGCVCCISAMLWGTPVLSENRSGVSIKEKIERERETLEKLKGEIEQKKKQAQEVEVKRGSVLESIQELDDRLIVSRQQRYSLNRKLKQRDVELEEISDQLKEVQARMRERRSSILARLRVQYKQGRLGYLKALLSAESPADLHRRFHYLSEISKREYDLLDSYQADADRLEEIEQRRSTARDHMFSLKQNTDQKLQEIRKLKREKKVFLAKISQEKEAYEQAIAELERSAARVDSILKELDQRRKTSRLPSKLSAAGYRGLKGALPWPVSGKVVSFFGRQKHPTFETYIERKGIEIRSAEGGEIRAVMDGTVAYADWLKGYGLVLILDHPNGFYSLYAHASKLLTKAGVRVDAGEVIGETGSTGLTGEDILYFELRDGADPVDPLLWLTKRP